MNPNTAMRTTLLAFGLLIALDATAQQPTGDDFPRARDRPASCEDFDWSEQMLREYPRVVDACQEVVVANDRLFARLSARFVRVQSNGEVSFDVRDRRDRYVDLLTIQPVAGQVAYINDRPTEFRDLRTSDAIDLYAAEGEYGFATRPTAASEPRAVVRTVAALPAPMPVDEPMNLDRAQIAQVDAAPRLLPQTAGLVPWLVLGALLSLIGGVGLTLHRRM
jgi:hypothetical protein